MMAKKKPAPSPDDVLAGLADIGLGRRDFPAYDKAGNEYLCKPTVGERLKALELLGKSCLLFTERGQEEENILRVELGEGVEDLCR